MKGFEAAGERLSTPVEDFQIHFPTGTEECFVWPRHNSTSRNLCVSVSVGRELSVSIETRVLPMSCLWLTIKLMTETLWKETITKFLARKCDLEQAFMHCLESGGLKEGEKDGGGVEETGRKGEAYRMIGAYFWEITKLACSLDAWMYVPRSGCSVLVEAIPCTEEKEWNEVVKKKMGRESRSTTELGISFFIINRGNCQGVFQMDYNPSPAVKQEEDHARGCWRREIIRDKFWVR